MRSRGKVRLCSVVGLLITMVVGCLTLARASSDFSVPPGRQPLPLNVTVGPDKNLWFTELTGEKIGRVTTSGTISEFALSGLQGATGIVAGPDGNIWFTDQLTGKIEHVNTTGGQLKKFSLPAGSYPQGITVGPDGNFWFVDQKQNGVFAIGKISPAGNITEFATKINAGPIQPFAANGYAQIVAGPDGNLWFVNPQLGNLGTFLVGRITTAGTITTFSLADSPQGICAGADGNLWVVESAHVAKITTGGAETEYALSRGGGFSGITPGPDGNVWFTELGHDVGYVTPTGVVTEFAPRTFLSIYYMYGIVAGPDGALWLTGSVTGNLGRLTTSGQLTNEYQLNDGSTPVWNALGSDGAVWFTELTNNKIGRIDTSGNVSSYSIPAQNAGLQGIAAGSDGNLWFLENLGNNVAKITPSGTVTEYSLGQTFQGVFGITEGPDGNVWFGEYISNNIAKVTPSGAITTYSVPTQSASPIMITAGPDGNVWFSENAVSQIGKIDPNTGTITEYPIGAGKSPGAISRGSDGNIWFLENTASSAVGVMSTSGQLLHEYALPFQNFPQGLVLGNDGALWVGQNFPNAVGRITTAGVVSSVPITVTNCTPNDLVVGSDGKLWVTDPASGDISRLSAIGGTGNNIKGVHNKALKGKVAKFVDGTPSANATDFTASINWGDGSKPSAGTVAGPTGGPFTVSGSHTYTQAGDFKVKVTLHDTVDNSNYQAKPGKATVK